MDIRFKILKTLRTTPYGKFFTIREVLVETPDGTRATFYLRDAQDFSIIIPFLSKDEVVMVRQHRVGPDYISLEFPMGTAHGKSPEEMARTELEEETGYKAETVTPIGSFYISNSSSSQMVHVFMAKGLTKGERHLEATEMIEVSTHTLSEVSSLIKKGSILDGPTITAFGFYLNTFGNNAEIVR